MGKKFFTPQEATAMLPYVIMDIRRLQEVKSAFVSRAMQLREMRLQRESGVGSVAAEDLFRIEAEMDFLQLETGTLAESVRLKGAELKDIDSGLVDFPGILDGEEVLLCWKFGEERIEYYHGVHEGYHGRKPLPARDD